MTNYGVPIHSKDNEPHGSASDFKWSGITVLSLLVIT